MEKKIFYHDTDSGGVVYYANYLKYLEEARTEFLEERCAGVPSILGRGMLYAVHFCNVNYKAPARYGDIIETTAAIKKLSAAQIVFEQQVLDKKTGAVLVEAEVGLVCLDQTFKPCAIPDDIKEKLH